MVVPELGRCVWCGSGDANREHVIGAQVRRAMRLEGTYRIALGEVFRGRDEETLNLILRRRVCAGCNGGWMKQIDDAFMRHLGSGGFQDLTMLSLDPLAQSWVARWVVKVTLLCELRLGDWIEGSNDPRVRDHETGYLPEGSIEHLGRTHLVPPNTQVWLGRLVRDDLVVMGARGSVHYHPSGEPHGVATSLHIGPFAFIVVAHDVHHPDRRDEVWDVPRIQLPDRYRDVFAPIYPATWHAVRWPPTTVISGGEFDTMTRSVLEEFRAFAAP